MFRACLIALLALQVGTGCSMFMTPDPTPPGFERIALRSEVDLTEEGELDGDTEGPKRSDYAAFEV